MTQTVIGMFDTADQAKSAAQQLAAAGFSLDHVDVASRNDDATATANRGRYRGNNHEESTGDSISNFFGNLFSDDDDDARRYAHAARESGSLVTVHAHSNENARQAAEILDRCGAVDVDERAEQSGYRSQAANANTNATANKATAGANAAVADADNQVSAKVIEENLQVGKRVEQTGGARLRSRIIERPVEASVRLREEHVNVDRKPVDRPASEADFEAFKEGDIEVTESAERAVVGKEARVVEEVTLGKEVTEREETIHDTVRKTEVDVEKLNSKDRPAGDPRR